MLRRFHQLKKHEEGQALVLAAICMLILTLCVLATVNLSYAATQKIRLQNAADSAAYTTAAYQARALNFIAFTNRTMVVQTASQMNMLAILTYMAFAAIVLTGLSYIPYIGFIFNFILQALKVFIKIWDVALMLLIPLVDGLNWGLGLAQAAVSSAIAAQAAVGSTEVAMRYNPNYRVDPIGDTLLRLGSVTTWLAAVDADALPFSFGGTDKNAELHRGFMTEIANSARHKWTAYGSENCSISALVIPRRCFGRFFGIVEVGKEARTEWGSFEKKGGFLGGLFNITEQLYSMDQFRAEIKIFGFGIRFEVGAWAQADRKMGGHEAFVRVKPICPGGRIIRKLCEEALEPITEPLAKAVGVAVQDVGFIGGMDHHLHIGQMPFAKYRPTGRFNNRLDPSNYFNQPPTLVMITLPKEELLRTGQPFMGKFGARIGTLTGANSNLDDKFGAGIKSGAPKRGWKSQVDFTAGQDRPLPFTQPGFTAMSAALAYYHRPGDWREPPNLFNPFWGAKLMPVAEFPTIAGNRLLSTLFSNQLLVH